jgi:hypothetical protein
MVMMLWGDFFGVLFVFPACGATYALYAMVSQHPVICFLMILTMDIFGLVFLIFSYRKELNIDLGDRKAPKSAPKSAWELKKASLRERKVKVKRRNSSKTWGLTLKQDEQEHGSLVVEDIIDKPRSRKRSFGLNLKQAGLREGDVIVRVEGEDLEELTTFQASIDKLKEQNTVRMIFSVHACHVFSLQFFLMGLGCQGSPFDNNCSKIVMVRLLSEAARG